MIEELPSRTLAYRFAHELVRRALYDRLTGVRRAELHLRVGEALERGEARSRPRARRPRAPLRRRGAAGRCRGAGSSTTCCAAPRGDRALAFEEAVGAAAHRARPGDREPARARRGAARAGHRRATAPARRGDALRGVPSGGADRPRARRHRAARARRDRLRGRVLAAGHGRPGRRRAARGGDRRARRRELRAARAAAQRAGPRARLPRRPRARGGRARAARSRWRAAAATAPGWRPADARVLVARDALARGDPRRCSPRPRRSARSSATPRSAPRRCPGACRRSSRSATSTPRGARSPRCRRRPSRPRSRSCSTSPRTTARRSRCATGASTTPRRWPRRSHEWSRLLTGRDASGVHGIQMFGVRREQGRLAELAPVIRLLAGRGRERAVAAGARRGARRAGHGRRGAARARADRAPTGSTRFRESLWLASLTLPDRRRARRCGDEATAALVYPELEPLAGTNVMIGHLVACYGAADRYLGMLAATLGEWDRAEEHFARATALNRRMGMLTWLGHTLYEHARARLARAATPRAPRRCCGEAAALAEANGLPLCSARMRALGPTPPRRVEALPDGLSSREVADPAPRRPRAEQPRDRRRADDQRAHSRQPRAQHPAQDGLRQPHAGGHLRPPSRPGSRPTRRTIAAMPLYVIERNFAEELDLTGEDVKMIERSTPTRASAGSSRSSAPTGAGPTASTRRPRPMRSSPRPSGPTCRSTRSWRSAARRHRS